MIEARKMIHAAHPRTPLLFAACFALFVAHGTAQTAAPPASPPAQHADQRGIDASIEEDGRIAAALAPFRERVAELNKPIAKLQIAIEKRGIGGGGVGNFVTDAVRAEAARLSKRRIDFAVLNTGGMRKNRIAAGPLSASDVYELVPFDNSLVVVELTGEQVARLLSEVTKARDAQSGAIITFAADAEDRNPRLVGATIDDAKRTKNSNARRGRDINPKKVYTVATLDYLVNRGGNYAVLKEARRPIELGVTIRDALIEHLRRETARGRTFDPALDGRFRRDRNSSGTSAAGATR